MVVSFQEKFSTILMISTIIRQNETTEIEKSYSPRSSPRCLLSRSSFVLS
jgi:hypothetical protein